KPQPGRKQSWELEVARYDSLKRLHDAVPMRHLAKRQKLSDVITEYETRERGYHWFNKRPAIEALVGWYFDEGLSTTQIAERVGCNNSSVWLWLTAAGYKLRPRGSPRVTVRT